MQADLEGEEIELPISLPDFSKAIYEFLTYAQELNTQEIIPEEPMESQTRE